MATFEKITTEALEAVERDAWLDMFEAAPPAFAAGAGLACRRFGEAAGFAIRAAPTIQFNRAQGLDPERPLEPVLQWLEGHASPAWAVQTVGSVINLERYRLAASGSWTKFSHDLADLPNPATSLSLRTVGPGAAMDFGGVVQAAFGAPPPFAGWAAALAGRPGWTTYVAYDGATPAAAGALFVRNGLAWLGLGACLPGHRGRGGQSALLARRLADAARAGARAAVTETGTPAPGEVADHPSWRNIHRAGFVARYERTNWRPK